MLRNITFHTQAWPEALQLYSPYIIGKVVMLSARIHSNFLIKKTPFQSIRSCCASLLIAGALVMGCGPIDSSHKEETALPEAAPVSHTEDLRQTETIAAIETPPALPNPDEIPTSRTSSRTDRSTSKQSRVISTSGGMITLEFDSGWSLLSFPLEEVSGSAGKSVEDYLAQNISNSAAIEAIWGWDDQDNWMVWFRNEPSGNTYPILELIRPNKAYWIQTTGTVTITGPINDQPVVREFQSGYNHMGFGGSVSQSPSDLFNRRFFGTVVNPIHSVWGWDNSIQDWRIWSPTLPQSEITTYPANYQPLTSIDPSQALWVRTNEAAAYDQTIGGPAVCGGSYIRQQVGRLGANQRLENASGMVQSHLDANRLFWVNESPVNGAMLFFTHVSGFSTSDPWGFVGNSEISIRDSQNNGVPFSDVEDIGAGSCAENDGGGACLFIADLGINSLYDRVVIAPEQITFNTVTVQKMVRVQYANFNGSTASPRVRAFTVMPNGNWLILSDSNAAPTLFQITKQAWASAANNGLVTAQPLLNPRTCNDPNGFLCQLQGSITVGGSTYTSGGTAMDVSRDGTRLIFQTHSTLLELKLNADGSLPISNGDISSSHFRMWDSGLRFFGQFEAVGYVSSADGQTEHIVTATKARSCAGNACLDRDVTFQQYICSAPQSFRSPLREVRQSPKVNNYALGAGNSTATLEETATAYCRREGWDTHDGFQTYVTGGAFSYLSKNGTWHVTGTSGVTFFSEVTCKNEPWRFVETPKLKGASVASNYQSQSLGDTAQAYCQAVGFYGAESYDSASSYGSHHAYVNSSGAWNTYGGVSINWLQDVNCVKRMNTGTIDIQDYSTSYIRVSGYRVAATSNSASMQETATAYCQTRGFNHYRSYSTAVTSGTYSYLSTSGNWQVSGGSNWAYLSSVTCGSLIFK